MGYASSNLTTIPFSSLPRTYPTSPVSQLAVPLQTPAKHNQMKLDPHSTMTALNAGIRHEQCRLGLPDSKHGWLITTTHMTPTPTTETNLVRTLMPLTRNTTTTTEHSRLLQVITPPSFIPTLLLSTTTLPLPLPHHPSTWPALITPSHIPLAHQQQQQTMISTRPSHPSAAEGITRMPATQPPWTLLAPPTLLPPAAHQREASG